MIKFYPNVGDILICDYTGFKEPEMVKKRPVIIISPRLRRRFGLCTVIPLSTTPPNDICDYHCKIKLANKLPYPFDAKEHWVKADMINTVSFERLDRFKIKDQFGKRKYFCGKVDENELKAVFSCVRNALDICKWCTDK